MFFGRFIAVLRVGAAAVAGLAHMPWWRFTFWNASGGIVWATAVGLAAYYGGHAVADGIQTTACTRSGSSPSFSSSAGSCSTRAAAPRRTTLEVYSFEPISGARANRPLTRRQNSLLPAQPPPEKGATHMSDLWKLEELDRDGAIQEAAEKVDR